MNNTKSILLFGETVVLCRELIITTKLCILSGDVGDILLDVIKDSRKGHSLRAGILYSNDLKKNIICKIIILLNEYFIEKEDSHLENILSEEYPTVPFKYKASSMLTKFCEIIIPIIDYLEIDDRLLIHNNDWRLSLLKLYNQLEVLAQWKVEFFNKMNWKIRTPNCRVGYHVSLLERYTLSNNHKIHSFCTPLPLIMKQNMENLFIPMRLN